MKKTTPLKTEKKSLTDKMKQSWRPAMGWAYVIICFFDFVIFPILWTLAQFKEKVIDLQQWVPITMSGAGMFHIAMGAVLGVAAWSRGQEKMAAANGLNNDASQQPWRRN